MRLGGRGGFAAALVVAEGFGVVLVGSRGFGLDGRDFLENLARNQSEAMANTTRIRKTPFWIRLAGFATNTGLHRRCAIVAVQMWTFRLSVAGLGCQNPCLTPSAPIESTHQQQHG